jgi:superfamily II DNA/RNA helicase
MLCHLLCETRTVFVAAETGSGKTLALDIPVAHHIVRLKSKTV